MKEGEEGRAPGLFAIAVVDLSLRGVLLPFAGRDGPLLGALQALWLVIGAGLPSKDQGGREEEDRLT
jgi:hypothetical protein